MFAGFPNGDESPLAVLMVSRLPYGAEKPAVMLAEAGGR
jgi:hypothetical protein